MLLRKYTLARLFATSLALASQRQPRTGNEVQWQSGDCIDRDLDLTTVNNLTSFQVRNPKNEPSACIKRCHSQNYPLAAVNGHMCHCGSKVSKGSVRINNEKCKKSCPGLPWTVCGGDAGWWNIFTTDGKIFTYKI